MKKVKVPEKADTSILYSTDSYAAKIIKGKTWDAGQFEGQEIYSSYAILGQKGKSWFKFLDDNLIEREKINLRNYKILYLPYITYERESVLKEIEKFVKKGGNLVCGDPLAFSFSPDGKDLSKERERLFGVRVIGPNYQDKIKIVNNKIFPDIPKGSKLSIFPDQHFSSTSQKIEVVDKKSIILAEFANGDPAIVLHQFGKGKTVYFAANPFTPEAIGSKNWVRLFQSLQRTFGAATDYKIWDFLIPVEFHKVEKWWLSKKPQGPDETGSYIRNGDFEKDTNQDNFPDFWEGNLSKGAPREIYTWEEGHQGKGLAIDNRKAKKWAEVITQVFGIKPNTEYKVSLWVKQTSSSALQLLARGKDFKFYYLSGVQPDKWTKLEKTINSRQNKGSWTISFLIENSPMKVWIDDVRMEEVTKKLSAGVSSQQPSASVIQNSSFETDSNSDGLPDNWEKYQHGAHWIMKITLDKENKHSGSYSIKFSSPEIVRGGIIQKKIRVEPGKTYQFKMWAKSENLISADVGAAVFFRWNPSAPQQYIDLNMLKGTSDWKLITKKVTVPSPAKTTNLSIEMYKGKGTIWIDNLEFEARE